MDSQVVAAWVAAGGAITAALVAAIASWRSASIARQTAKEVEAIRSEQEQLRAAYEFRHFIATQQVENITAASSALQIVRDELRSVRKVILAGPLTQPEYSNGIQRAIQACRTLQERYQEHHAILPVPIRALFHEAKNNLNTILSDLHYFARSDKPDTNRIKQALEHHERTLEKLNGFHREVLVWIDGSANRTGAELPFISERSKRMRP